MSTSTDTALRRSLRRFTLGSGPLKRGSDRLQVAGRLVVVLALLVAPPLAVAATAATTSRLEALAAAGAAERSRVDAVLLEDAPEAGASGYGEQEPVTVPARAVWPVPGGTEREGIVLVSPHTAAGTAVPVWVDRDDGHVTSPPMDRSRIDGSAMGVGAVFLLGVPLATWTLYVVLCAALDAHRQRRWAQGWAAVEPEWGTRLL
ncbi:Rv1733c family protein [Geodermatophilus sabuli]|uniref:Uncharacterized protein n=1 Tax=Geodermatophilus sabuli TaxID=1564158 RepID=A0A285EE94_9ACTN|nr:hypothetical protein [Geodermatophilus sabuli]MBB3084498.1 hypothetical protein [Geodermatophilus sabuli]SNX97307.1 hypothetical protein SAMN06893097_106257 [Geodermatophilus sabuli]